MTGKRWMVGCLGVAILLGCQRAPTPAPTPLVTALPTPSGPGFSGGGVVASGQVVPVVAADLGFTVAGRVQAVAVVRGDRVQSGQVLITLETARLEAEVAQAEAALAAARARLARLEAGPRPEEIVAAEARLAAAEGDLAQAQAQGDQPDLGATEAEVAAARALVAAAMADRLAAEEVHNRTMTCVEVDLPGGGERTVCPALGPVEEQARHSWQAAEQALDAAQAQLDGLLAGGDAEVRAAEAQGWIAAAGRDAAQAHLDLLLAGATAEEIADAESAVAQAEAALQAAQAGLAQATLRAPFAGVVAGVEVGPGEAVTPGPGILTLADVTPLQVETTDLGERDVARVAVGQRATVYVEPLGVQVGGRVVRISSGADRMGGDVVYPVTITLDEQPPGLRWGMSVEVQIGEE